MTADGIVGKNTRAALKTLRNGSGGNLVRVLQALLVCNGYTAAYVDGDFGDGTETAVTQYQRAHGLDDDGVVGKYTWAKLLKA